MSHQFNQGEFIYLPSDGFIYKLAEGRFDLSHRRRTREPKYLMFIRDNLSNSSYCDVFFEGSVWSVRKDDIYVYEGGK